MFKFKDLINKNFPKNKNLEKVIAGKNIKNIKNIGSTLSKIGKLNFNQNNDESEGIPANSIISKTVFSYDIPEISKLELEFVYNFFEKNERSADESRPGESIINLNADKTSEILYAIKNEKLPRYVRFSFKQPRDPFAKIATANDKTLANNIDKIAREGAGSDRFFTGFEIFDTGAEKTIYSNLRSTGFALDFESPDNSSLETAKKIADTLEDPDGLTGLGKKFILESLNQLKDGEMQFARADVSPRVASFSDNPVGRQTFSVKINNLFIDDIISKANRLPTSVMQDELLGLTAIASDYQKNTLSKIGNDPTQLNEDQFTNQIDAFEILSGNPFGNSKIKSYESLKNYEITMLGYMIEKTEILPNESIVTYDPYIITDPQKLYITDENVRYGGNYLYTVRTVCQVITPVVKLDPDDPILDEVVYAKFIMASEGISKSILCIEKEPPPPPANLKARFDFRLKAPILSWSFPLNPQRDIKRFQIFKRRSINEAFTLVAEYDFDNSIDKTSVSEVAIKKNLFKFEVPKITYTDTQFNIMAKPIYAVASVDAHGMTSNLSNQIKVEYDKYKNKVKTSLVSRENAPKPYPNIYLEEDTFKDIIKVSGYDRMHVFFDPEYYRILKNSKTQKEGSKKEEDLNLLSINPDEPTYSIQILNLDIQKDEVINITIEDRSGFPKVFTAKSFGKKYISNKK